MSQNANNWSISRLSEAFGMARETIAKRLREAGVVATGKKKGYPSYDLKDAAQAIFVNQPLVSGDADPSSMPPRERRDWYESELKRINYEERLGELCEAEKVAVHIAEAFKHVALSLDTMADVIERDAGLEPEQIDIMQRIIDGTREKLYQEVARQNE